MKQLFFLALFLTSLTHLAQETETSNTYALDVSAFYGSIALHNTDITHLIEGHPTGFMVGFNKKTFGKENWEGLFNYPDFGYSFIYQDMKSESLGDNYALYLHYNFYFLKRHLQLRLGQGLAYNTNPYDKNTNFRNNAFGTTIMSSTYVFLNYQKENIFNGLGFKAGLGVVHYSNGNFKAPNTSTNSVLANAGFTYNLDGGQEIEYMPAVKTKIIEPIKYNLVFRTGINEGDVIGLGQHPFYIFSGYADKRFSRKSAIQFGADLFLSRFLKELIRYQSIAFPETGVQADDDYKRVGMFIGHEFFVNKTSFISQVGYYVYYPYDFEGKTYFRIGFKRYLTNNIFAGVTLKTHAAKAEAVEFGIGIRF